MKTVVKDGYRAILSFSKDERFQVAVRGEWRRVEAAVDGAPLVKIMRPDLKKVWQIRPSTKKLMETTWNPTDEIVPGYPLEPRFDPHAYADRFGGKDRADRRRSPRAPPLRPMADDVALGRLS